MGITIRSANNAPISKIYEGPMVGYRSNGRGKAKVAKAKVWTVSASQSTSSPKASDRDRKPQHYGIRTPDKYVDVHTPMGLIRGLNVHKNEYGLYITLAGHDVKIESVGPGMNGVYVQKGKSLDECRINRFHHNSPVKV